MCLFLTQIIQLRNRTEKVCEGTISLHEYIQIMLYKRFQQVLTILGLKQTRQNKGNLSPFHDSFVILQERLTKVKLGYSYTKRGLTYVYIFVR